MELVSRGERGSIDWRVLESGLTTILVFVLYLRGVKKDCEDFVGVRMD